MNNISVSGDSGHEHRVEVGFSEERGRRGDCRRDVVIAHLSDLALVTTLYKPFDVVIEVWPPKVFKECNSDCVDLLVSKGVVDLPHDGISSQRGDDDLVLAVQVTAPELVIADEEVGTVLDKLADLGLVEAIRPSE